MAYVGVSASGLTFQVEGETRPTKLSSLPRQAEKKLTEGQTGRRGTGSPPRKGLACLAVKVKCGSLCTCQDYLHGRG